LLEAAALALLNQILWPLPVILQILSPDNVNELVALALFSLLEIISGVVLSNNTLLDFGELLLLNIYELGLLSSLKQLEYVHSLHL